jgi:hypothetical protein
MFLANGFGADSIVWFYVDDYNYLSHTHIPQIQTHSCIYAYIYELWNTADGAHAPHGKKSRLHCFTRDRCDKQRRKISIFTAQTTVYAGGMSHSLSINQTARKLLSSFIIPSRLFNDYKGAKTCALYPSAIMALHFATKIRKMQQWKKSISSENKEDFFQMCHQPIHSTPLWHGMWVLA